MTENTRRTRALLSAYRGQLKQVKCQREQVAELRRAALRGRTSKSRSSGAGVPTEAAVLRLEQEREKLRWMETVLTWRRCVAKAYLNSVNDPITHAILWMRYMDGLSWKQIAVRHGAGASEDAMRKIAVRYMERHPLVFIR